MSYSKVSLSHKVVASAAAAIVCTALVVNSNVGQTHRLAREADLGSVQLIAAFAADLNSAIDATYLQAATPRPVPSRGAARIASSSAAAIAIPDSLRNVAIAALGVIGSPLWYVGLPVTLPVSIALASQLLDLYSLFSVALGGLFGNPFADPNPIFAPGQRGITTLLLGLRIFAAGPFLVVRSALAGLITPGGAEAGAAVTTSKPGVRRSVAVAHPRNRASVDRKPSAGAAAVGASRGGVHRVEQKAKGQPSRTAVRHR